MVPNTPWRRRPIKLVLTGLGAITMGVIAAVMVWQGLTTGEFPKRYGRVVPVETQPIEFWARTVLFTALRPSSGLEACGF